LKSIDYQLYMSGLTLIKVKFNTLKFGYEIFISFEDNC